MDEEVSNKEDKQEEAEEKKEEEKTEESKPDNELEKSEENKEPEKKKENIQETKEEVKKDKFEKMKEYKNNLTDKMRKNPWVASTFFLGIFMLVIIITGFSGITGGTVDERDIGDLALDFFNNKLSNNPGTLESIEDVSGVYKIEISVENQGTFPLYFTKNGEWINQGTELISISADSAESENTETQNDIPKSDKPVVELFVVSYCPYGIGAEKGFLPVLKLLKEEADLQITFMHTQHGEKEDKENKLQICLREEQSSKYLDYLECFLEDGSSERCLIQAKIDKSKLDTCLDSKIEEYHLEDISSTEEYSITGSPSLIINGVKASIPQLKDRTPSNFLDLICSAFNEEPDECSQLLSSEIQSPQFGYSSDSDPNSGGQC